MLEVITLIILLAILYVCFRVIRWYIRLIPAACRETRDCIRVVRRGRMNPLQLRQEFIETMGREPTIAEVHDLHGMIKSEYNQALLSLGVLVGGAVLGARAISGKKIL